MRNHPTVWIHSLNQITNPATRIIIRMDRLLVKSNAMIRKGRWT